MRGISVVLHPHGGAAFGLNRRLLYLFLFARKGSTAEHRFCLILKAGFLKVVPNRDPVF
jgi:hypothetical protein